ncbi:MAG: hypothetical protein U0939_01715 [Pirellulales bacterium]
MNARRLNFALLASLLAAVAASLLVAAAFHFGDWGRPAPSQALLELRLAPDASLAPRLQRWSEREDAPAWELLVRALAHERLALRDAARDVLSARLDRWSLLPVAESSRRAGDLARELRLQAGQLPADVRPFAADVVARLLMTPGDSLVDDCVAALRLLGPDPRREVTRPLVDSTSPSRSGNDSDSIRTAGQDRARK